MDENEILVEENHSNKKGRALLVLGIITTLITCILFGLYTITLVEGKFDTENLGSVLVFIIGVAYILLPAYFFSILTIIFNTIAFKKGKESLVRKIFFIISLVILLLLIIETIITFIPFN